MNFVTALGQFQPQFGCDHAAAAIGRIARNADFHALLFHFSPSFFPFDGRRAAGIQMLTESFMRGERRIALERALHVLGGLRVGGHGLGLPLQALLSRQVEAGKLNAHADSTIAGPDHRWGGNLFRTQPERDG